MSGSTLVVLLLVMLMVACRNTQTTRATSSQITLDCRGGNIYHERIPGFFYIGKLGSFNFEGRVNLKIFCLVYDFFST